MQLAPAQTLLSLQVPLTWGTSSTHLPSCFLATWVPYSLGEGAELNPLPIHPWGSGGDTGHGSHVVGTQGTVVAVGDAVSATDLTQDEGTRSHGLARFGATQVRAAVNLGRQNSSAASASHLHSARPGPLDFRGLCRGKSERF